MDLLISETQALNWKDNPPPLQPCALAEAQNLQLILIGKLVSLKIISRSHVGLGLQRTWRFVNSLSIADMGPNIFLFKFKSELEFQKVMEQSPWNISGHPLFLQKWDPEIPLEEVDFSHGTYWMQIYGLPPDHMTYANATSIGNWLGQLLEVDHDADLVMQLAKCLRIKVSLNISQPLPQGFLFNRPGKPPCRVHFRYERLSEFCFKCGKLGHISPTCPVFQPPLYDPPYSASMRAFTSLLMVC